MAAPTNTSSATATDLGTWPVSLTQDANFGGTTYTLWFTFMTDAAGMLNLLAYGGGTAYVCALTLYASDATSILYFNRVPDRPVQFPVDAATRYYVRIESQAGNVADPAILTLTGAVAPTTDPVAGDYLVTDDQEPFWGLVVSPTDGTPRRFFPMVNGEFGDVIPNGSGGWIYALTNDDEDVDDIELVYYDSTFLEISRPYKFAVNVRALRGNGSDRIYVADSSPIGTVRAIDRAGDEVGSWTLAVQLSAPMAPSRDDTVLYFVEIGSSKPIRRWDLVNNTELSNLVAAPSGYTAILDMLVLVNGHVLVCWNTSGDTYVAEYQPDGTLVRTYPVTFPSTEKNDGPRLAINKDDTAASFIVWVSGDDAPAPGTTPTFIGRFTEFSTADGSVIRTFDRDEFEGGIGPGGLSADWPAYGNSKSCPIIVLRTAVNAPTVAIPPFDCGNAIDPVTVTITGTDFGSDPTVTAVDPDGNTIPFTITSHTTTQIVGTLIVATCGVWSITVCNGSLCTSVSVDTGTDYLMRRERRFLLPFDQNFRIFISRLEIIAQTGVGRSTGQGADPVLMLRMSWDGGFTWGHERQLSIGKMGEYVRRCYTTRLGSGRMPVCEIACSDPVFLSLLDCTVDAEKGTS